jgi:predicted enzyme related to lactoylglutathione lyase
MKNSFCHVELTTDNPGKAKEFYGQLFSWTFEDAPMPGGTYTMIKPGEGPGGGLMQKPNAQVPTAWLAYVMVDSVENTVAKARKLGGKVLMDKTPIPNMGAFAVLSDPTGGVLGVYEEKSK